MSVPPAAFQGEKSRYEGLRVSQVEYSVFRTFDVWKAPQY